MRPPPRPPPGRAGGRLGKPGRLRDCRAFPATGRSRPALPSPSFPATPDRSPQALRPPLPPGTPAAGARPAAPRMS